jgi:hypothetical protein
MRALRKALGLAAVLACALCIGCSVSSTKDLMLGSWELDKDATRSVNPVVGTLPRGVRFDFNADGTGVEALGGLPRKITWKVVQEEGPMVTVEITAAGAFPGRLRVTAVDANHLKVHYSKGLGTFHLQRRPPGARDEAELMRAPDDSEALAALKGTKIDLTTDTQGSIVSVGFPLGVKRDEVAAALPQLKKLPSLVAVNLGLCGLTDEDLKPLQDLHQVKNLLLNGNPITDKGLEQLAGLTNLHELSLSDDRAVTDRGVEHLKGLTGLRLLSLDGTQVTDDGLAHLKGLTELRTLKLYATQVKGPGLAHLQGLPKLESLYLAPAVLGAATPDVLKGLSHLQEIYLSGKASAEAVEKTKKALPSCKVK